MKQDKVSGLYHSHSTPRMWNQPDKETAFAQCKYYKHPGYMSVGMVRQHNCMQKVCPHLQPLDHPYWEDIHLKKGAKVTRIVMERLHRFDYFAYQDAIYTTKDPDEVDEIIKKNHIYSTGLLVFGNIGDATWEKIHDEASQKDTKNKESKEEVFVMVTFGEQLDVWKTAKKINVKDLGARSGLGKARVQQLLDNQDDPTKEEIDKLCRVFQTTASTFLRGVTVNLKIDNVTLDVPNVEVVSTLKDTKESMIEPEYQMILDQYRELPSALRKEISRCLATWVHNKTNYSMAHIDSVSGLSICTVSKWVRMTAAAGCNAISKVANGVSDVIPKEAFYKQLESMCTKFIGNYNLSVAKDVYGFFPSTLVTSVGKDPSMGSLIMTYKTTISNELGVSICDILQVPWDDFKRRIYTKRDFTADKKAVLNAINRVVSEAKDTNTVKPSTKDDTPVLNHKNSSEAKSSVDEARLTKMWNRLSPEHKTKISDLIEKYFWEDLA